MTQRVGRTKKQLFGRGVKKYDLLIFINSYDAIHCGPNDPGQLSFILSQSVLNRLARSYVTHDAENVASTQNNARFIPSLITIERQCVLENLRFTHFRAFKAPEKIAGHLRWEYFTHVPAHKYLRSRHQVLVIPGVIIQIHTVACLQEHLVGNGSQDRTISLFGLTLCMFGVLLLRYVERNSA